MEHESYDDKLSRLHYKVFWEPNDASQGECQACGSMKTRRTFDDVLVCRKCGHYDKN